MKTTDYKEIIEEYSSEGYFLYAGKKDDSELERWKDKEVAKKYLDKYWLPEEEYISVWKPLRATLFDPSKRCFPELLFPSDFHIFPLLSGLTFNPKSLEKVKYLMRKAEEDYFVLIQNVPVGEKSNIPLQLRLKYPIVITWDELMSGGFISTVLFEMWHSDYFVFGTSGLWGRYVANEYDTPLDLFAVKNNLASLVEPNFVNSKTDTEELKKIIPDIYKSRYRIHF